MTTVKGDALILSDYPSALTSLANRGILLHSPSSVSISPYIHSVWSPTPPLQTHARARCLIEVRISTIIIVEMPVKLDELEAALRGALSIQHLVRPLVGDVAPIVDIQTLTGSFRCPYTCLYPLCDTIGPILFFPSMSFGRPRPIDSVHSGNHTQPTIPHSAFYTSTVIPSSCLFSFD